MSEVSVHDFFKKIIVIFWAVWWLIAFWTDVVGGLAHMQWLHASWAPDANYPFLAASLKMYTTSNTLIGLLFVGILLWSFTSALAFICASIAIFTAPTQWMKLASLAFVISLSLWLAFFLADQLVMKFDLEENHMVQGGFELLTFLSLYLLPNHASKERI